MFQPLERLAGGGKLKVIRLKRKVESGKKNGVGDR
jgi:hypothetical protein